MPWWSWLVIWTVLVLGLLGMLALFAVSLFRKVMAAGREISELAAKADVLSGQSSQLADPPFRTAVFADAAQLGDERADALVARAFARQARRDARVKRGKLLVDADPSAYAYLTKRT
jgi:hypothetical protein